jgi:hypothetical protein
METKNAQVTLARIRRWPPTCSIEQAAEACGVSRSSLYQAVREGTAPLAIIRVRRRQRVLTSSLIDLLQGSRQASA